LFVIPQRIIERTRNVWAERYEHIENLFRVDESTWDLRPTVAEWSPASGSSVAELAE
jgi:hypothetical protein